MYGRYFSSTFVLRFLALLLWMLLIFAFSSMPGGPSLSQPDPWYFFERKGAHVLEYFVLFILAVRFFRVLYFRRTLREVALLAAVFCLAYGATDELHQYFTPFRGAKLQDVFFDGIGTLFGALAVYLDHLLKKS